LSNASSVFPEDTSLEPAVNCFLAAEISLGVGGGGIILVPGAKSAADAAGANAFGFAIAGTVTADSCARISTGTIIAISTPAAIRIDEQIL
jgi:hypothetical protein